VRATGDNIAISPPLIINDDQIDQIASALAGAIRRLT
jgi:adenosylmethionine-8-amino-7-oxononanoate aminotransferase